MHNRTIVLRSCMSLWFVLVLTSQAWSAPPGFDLDLKELNKPLQLPEVTKKKPVTTRKKASRAVKQLTPAKSGNKISASSQKESDSVLQPIAPSELALKGGNACQLAERMAAAVAQPVPTEPLLNGLNLQPVIAVRHGNLNLLLTCGLPAAEAYTYSRLLEEHQVRLINLEGNETVGQIAQGMIERLGLSCQVVLDNSSMGGELIYLFPAGQERQRALRLTLQP